MLCGVRSGVRSGAKDGDGSASKYIDNLASISSKFQYSKGTNWRESYLHGPHQAHLGRYNPEQSYSQ